MRPNREDVLDALAMEQECDRETLERYLRDYPEFAVELIDLSRELSVLWHVRRAELLKG